MGNVPTLRFGDFTSVWQSVELGDMTSWASGGTPSKAKSEYWNGDIPWISASSMRGNYFSDSENKVTKRAIGNGTRLVPEKTILLLVRGSMLYNAIPVGMTTKPVTFNQDVKAITFDTTVNGQFGLQWFLQAEHRLLNMVSGTGIGAGKLDTADLQHMSFSYPSLQEQQKIAAFLTAVDTKIEQLTQKEALLKQYKKGVMQKIFSQEIRFKADDGSEFPEWETTSLQSVAQVIDPHPSHRAPPIDPSGIPFIGIGDINTRGLLDYKNVRLVSPSIFDEHQCRYKVEVGDFAFGRVASVGKVVDLSDNANKKYTYSPTMAIIKPFSINAKYLRYFCSSDLFTGLVETKTTGSTRKSLGVQNLRTLAIFVPDAQEQEKISIYLESLDTKIAVSTSNLEWIKTFKKGLLQQMFV